MSHAHSRVTPPNEAETSLEQNPPGGKTADFSQLSHPKLRYNKKRRQRESLPCERRVKLARY
jgi:hypothetical protein